MGGVPSSLAAFLETAADEIAEACTRCGKCVEICPVVPFGPAAGAEPSAVAGDVVSFLTVGTTLGEAASAWAETCNGCGQCLPACSEGVNPRRMLMLAGIRSSAISSRTPQLFRRMTRAIKLMAAMQLVPAEYVRLIMPPRPRSVPVVFYLGCNALRTPHLLFNTMQVLDALEVDYEIVGGPSSCCGVINTKWQGEIQVGEHVTSNTLRRFEGFTPERVVNWCPTCQLHVGETLRGFRERSFDFDHVTAFLVSRLDDLSARFTTPVAKRVVLHAHVGRADIGADVARLLTAIPGLELVETVMESGYTCGGSGCSRAPELAAREHAELLKRVRETDADVLATLYHGCHAAFVAAEGVARFEVLNFTDLLVEALGATPHTDRLKHYKLLQDWKSIVDEALPYLQANGMNIDPAWLERYGRELFASTEFKGGLECVDSAMPTARP